MMETFAPATIDQAIAGYRASAAATDRAVELAESTCQAHTVWMRLQEDPKDRTWVVAPSDQRDAVEAEHGPVLWISTERPEATA